MYDITPKHNNINKWMNAMNTSIVLNTIADKMYMVAQFNANTNTICGIGNHQNIS